jgi:hypothetical protein
MDSDMSHDWQTLTRLTGGAPMQMERVRLIESGIAIEGEFELPRLAQLTEEDQVFVAAFVRCHGSIKQMEKYFGVSYPTIKNRLNRIGELVPFAEIQTEPESEAPSGSESTPGDLLTRLERGEMSVQDVLAKLTNKKK